MALRDSLEGSFGGGGFDLEAAVGGVASGFDAVSIDLPPLDRDALGEIARGLESLDLDAIAGAVAQMAGVAREQLGELPLPGGLLTDVIVSVQTLEDVVGGVRGAFGATTALIEAGPQAATPVGRAVEVTGVLAGLDTGALVRLLPETASAGGLLGRLLALVPAVQIAVETAALTAALQQRARRLVALGEELTDAGGADVAGALASLAAWDPGALVAKIASGAPAGEIVAAVRTPLDALAQYSVVAGHALLFAEIALEDFDAVGAPAAIGAAAARIRTSDIGAVRVQAEALRDVFQPLLEAGLGDPAASLDAFWAQAEARLTAAAADVADLDLSPFTDQLTATVDALRAPVRAADAAIGGLTGAIEDALESVAAAIRSLDLDVIATAVKAVLQPVEAALLQAQQLVDAVTDAIATAADEAADALTELRETLKDATAELREAFESLAQAVDDLHLDTALGELPARVQEVRDAIAAIDVRPAVATTSDLISTAASIIGALPLDLLPESARRDVQTAVGPVKDVDFDADVADPAREVLREALAALQGEALPAVAEAYAQVLEFLDEINPRPPLEQLEAESFDPFLARVAAVDPDAMLAPLLESLPELPDPAGVLTEADAAFDELLAQLDRFSPQELIEPFVARVDEVRAALVEESRLEQWEVELDRVQEAVHEAVDGVDVEAVASAAAAVVEELFGEGSAGRPAAAFGTLIFQLVAGGDLDVGRAPQRVLPWLRGADVTAAVESLRGEALAGMEAARAALRELAPGEVLTLVAPKHAALVAAVEALPPGELRTQLEALLVPTPQAALAPAIAARGRCLLALDAAIVAVNAIDTSVLGAVETALAGLRNALEPLLEIRDLGLRVLERTGAMTAGADPVQALRSLAASVAAHAPGPLVALQTAVQVKLKATFDDSIAEVRAAIGDVRGLAAAIDLRRVASDLDGVETELRTELEALRPSQVLGGLVSALQTARTAISEFDPLAGVREPVERMKTELQKAGDELRPTALLVAVLDTYDEVCATLALLDVVALLQPLVDVAGELATDVGDGLVEVGDSFERLQSALPGPT